jgi:hypothetical protein
MRALDGRRKIPAMTHPLTSSKLLLVADTRPASAQREVTPVRRYRLARLRSEARPVEPARRFEHLKRVYE